MDTAASNLLRTGTFKLHPPLIVRMYSNWIKYQMFKDVNNYIPISTQVSPLPSPYQTFSGPNEKESDELHIWCTPHCAILYNSFVDSTLFIQRRILTVNDQRRWIIMVNDQRLATIGMHMILYLSICYFNPLTTISRINFKELCEFLLTQPFNRFGKFFLWTLPPGQMSGGNPPPLFSSYTEQIFSWGSF